MVDPKASSSPPPQPLPSRVGTRTEGEAGEAGCLLLLWGGGVMPRTETGLRVAPGCWTFKQKVGEGYANNSQDSPGILPTPRDKRE